MGLEGSSGQKSEGFAAEALLKICRLHLAPYLVGEGPCASCTPKLTWLSEGVSRSGNLSPLISPSVRNQCRPWARREGETVLARTNHRIAQRATKAAIAYLNGNTE